MPPRLSLVGCAPAHRVPERILARRSAPYYRDRGYRVHFRVGCNRGASRMALGA